MTATELIESVMKAGGTLKLEGDRVSYWLPREAAHLIDHLRRLKREIIPLLTARGGRIATFPHCPRCASYAMFREQNEGPFECLTCGRRAIEESTARRLA
jgi:transcription initiation factor IIE alpha subunit